MVVGKLLSLLGFGLFSGATVDGSGIPNHLLDVAAKTLSKQWWISHQTSTQLVIFLAGFQVAINSNLTLLRQDDKLLKKITNLRFPAQKRPDCCVIYSSFMCYVTFPGY